MPRKPSAQTVSAAELAELKKAAEAAPDSAAAHLKLGTALAKRGALEEAESVLRKCLEINAKNAGAWVNLGGIFLARWDFKACIDANEHAIECDPTLLIAHYNLGIAHMYGNNPESMLESFERVIEIDPRHAAGHYHLAVALNALGRKEEARKYIETAGELGHSPDPKLVKSLDKAQGGVSTLELTPNPKPQTSH